MKRTTLFMDEALEGDLQALARRQKRRVASLVREAIARYVADEKRQTGLTLGFLAVGRSGHGDVAERHEELLWQDLEPHPAAPAAGTAGTPRPQSSGGRARRRSTRKR